MKKILFIALYILGICCFASCRSTTKPCGLADNLTVVQIVNSPESIL
jgi:hypothetical protein